MTHYQLVVIGAGAGGLVVAIGASKAGKKVLLIEKGHYGGDCTNFGCIPSKTLISSAEKAHALKEGKEYGIEFETPQFKAVKALERVRAMIAHVRSHEDPPALDKLGVKTLTGLASFENPHELNVEVTDGKFEKISADKIVIAAGSHAFIPPIEGIKDAPYLTNETIFDLKEIPKQLAVLGAGPIGCELAQAFSRLGSEVIIIESLRGVMPNEDPDVDTVMAKRFQDEGIKLYTRCDANLISYKDGKFLICITENGEHHDIEAEALLVSTGRRPNVADLKLDNARVEHSDKGIVVDAYGRTNQSHIFAVGDIVGAPFFTHLAENHGRAVLTSLILPGPLMKKIDKQALPRVTFTDPEVASVGLSEKQAKEMYGENKLAIYKVPFEDLDRAMTTGRTEGYVKVITKKWSSKIVGATIIAPRAGEMLPELSLAMLYNIPLRKLARLIHPYPTFNAAIRKAADMWLTQTILPKLRGKKS